MLDQTMTPHRDEELYSVANDLIDKAKDARQSGDMNKFKKLMRAALDCVEEEDRPLKAKGTGDLGQIIKLRGVLAEGWQEVETLSQKMGVGTSRIHTLIAKMRRSGEPIQALSFKKYRINQTEN